MKMVGQDEGWYQREGTVGEEVHGRATLMRTSSKIDPT